MNKEQFNCPCGHGVEEHAEGDGLGHGTFCRKCSCRRYRLQRPTTLALDGADSAASPSESAGETDQRPETDSALPRHQ